MFSQNNTVLFDIDSTVLSAEYMNQGENSKGDRYMMTLISTKHDFQST